MHTIPIGFHKPWLYHPNDIILGPQVERECKFLKHIFNVGMSAWEWK